MASKNIVPNILNTSPTISRLWQNMVKGNTETHPISVSQRLEQELQLYASILFPSRFFFFFALTCMFSCSDLLCSPLLWALGGELSQSTCSSWFCFLFFFFLTMWLSSPSPSRSFFFFFFFPGQGGSVAGADCVESCAEEGKRSVTATAASLSLVSISLSLSLQGREINNITLRIRKTSWHLQKENKNKNLELGRGRRLTGAGGSSAVWPGTEVENRRNPDKNKTS